MPVRALVLSAALASGCLAGDAPCDPIRDRVEACYGAEAAGALDETASCEPAHAEYVQQLDCDQLAAAIAGGKADDTLGETVAAAIREGLKVALAQAFDAVYEQLAGAGIDRDAVSPFFLLSRHDDREEADLARNHLSQILDPANFSPVVVRSGDGYDVIHSACPIDAPALVAGAIAEAIIDPEFLPAIGVELVVEPTETGQTIRFPLQLVLFDADYARDFGCDR